MQVVFMPVDGSPQKHIVPVAGTHMEVWPGKPTNYPDGEVHKLLMHNPLAGKYVQSPTWSAVDAEEAAALRARIQDEENALAKTQNRPPATVPEIRMWAPPPQEPEPAPPAPPTEPAYATTSRTASFVPPSFVPTPAAETEHEA